MLRVEHQLPSLKHLHQGAIIKGRNRPREVEHQPQEDSRWCTPTMRTVAQLHERPQTRGGTWLQRRSWLRGALRAGWCERRPTCMCPPTYATATIMVGVLPCGRTFRSPQSSLVCGSCSRASKQPEGAQPMRSATKCRQYSARGSTHDDASVVVAGARTKNDHVGRVRCKPKHRRIHNLPQLVQQWKLKLDRLHVVDRWRVLNHLHSSSVVIRGTSLATNAISPGCETGLGPLAACLDHYCTRGTATNDHGVSRKQL